MINHLARYFRHDTLVGKTVRLPLSLVPGNTVVPIMSGINKGLRWITGTGPNRGCWLGNYEADHFAALPGIVKPGMIAYDLGANAGFYSMALSRLVGPTGHVFAFEPEAANVHALRRHIQINGLKNVTIIQAAISDRRGIVSFDGAFSSGRIVGQGNYLVPSISLDEFIASGNPSPNFLKMDIEGAELDAFKGAGTMLQNSRTIICLAVHTLELHDGCISILDSHDYRRTALDGVSDPGEHGDFLAFPA